MNASSPTTDLRTPPGEDSLDRALSAFFKSQMKHPWPAAPLVLSSEPSALVTNRNASAHNGSARSRVTLAVSIAVLLGTCWCLSNGFQSDERKGPAASTAFPMLPDAGASDPAVLKERRKDQAIHGGAVAPPARTPKIQLP